MPSTEESVFVYGTLRRGERNHRLLENTRYVSELDLPGFQLFTLGRFPFILPDESGQSIIRVEHFMVSPGVLAQLDRLEDYYGPSHPDNLYDRITASSPAGASGWLYVFSEQKLPIYRRSARLLEHGDWTRR